MTAVKVFGFGAVVFVALGVLAVAVGTAIRRMGGPDPYQHEWQDLLDRYGYREEEPS